MDKDNNMMHICINPWAKEVLREEEKGCRNRYCQQSLHYEDESVPAKVQYKKIQATNFFPRDRLRQLVRILTYTP